MDKFLSVLKIKPEYRNLTFERLKYFSVGISCFRAVQLIHEVNDDSFAGFALVINRFMHDRRRQKNNVTHVNIVGNTFNKMSSIRRKKDQHLVIWMEMLELHVYRGISFIIINIVKNIVRDVVDNYIVVVFVINTVIYKHENSIYEKERGIK
ncbi:hypothetical protein [Butyrivibrio sp. AE2015]|uniref:hypothetical protein n=1 Tax=Butyrivibrio sp. AE2015 TaxID=1280663 RepID=UPI003FA431F9